MIDPVLNALVVDLFNADVCGNLRRVQGLIRSCTKEMNEAGRDLAIPRITQAIATMRLFKKVRVGYFQELLAQARRQSIKPQTEREIQRQPGNPMLRYAVGDGVTSTQENLDL